MIEHQTDERSLAELLQATDAQQPRPAGPRITLAILRARARRRALRQLTAAAALLAVAALTALTFARRAKSSPPVLDRVAARALHDLQRRDAALRQRSAASAARANLAVERTMLVRLHYAESLYRQGLPEGQARLSALAEHEPNTLGGRDAAVLLADTTKPR